MVETRTSQPADKKDNGKSLPKPKPSKVQEARQTAPATEGLRRSTREKRGSARAREAAANVLPPTQKSKKPSAGRGDKKKADSSVNAKSGRLPATTKEAAPPRKKSKTGRSTTLDPATENVPTQPLGEGKRRAVEGASKAADRRTRSKSSKDLVARNDEHVTVTKESDNAPTDQLTGNNVPGRTFETGDNELIVHRPISNEPSSTSTDVNIASPEHQVSNNRRHSPSREISPAGATQIGDQDDARDPDPSTVPSGLRRDITRQALFLSGWETAHLGNDNLRSCCVEQFARLPSPIADFGNRHDGLTALLEAHVHRGVRYSYEQFAKEWTSLRDRLQSDNAISTDGANGKFCALTDRNVCYNRKGKARMNDPEISSIEIYSDTDQNPGEIHIPLNNLFLGQPIVRGIPSYSNTRKNLIIRRLPSTETGGDIGYFIINHDIQLLALNESAIGTNMIAGPLPDFALITIGHLVGFWWCTREALDHIPAPQRRKRKRDNDDDDTGEVDNSDEEDEDVVRAEDGDEELEVSSYGSDFSLEAWNERLNERLRHFRRRQADIYSELPADKLRTFASRIKSSSALADEEVIIGIGTLWEGLRKQGRLYAYGGLDVFISTSDFGGEEHRNAVGVVGRPNDFIMPLFFPSSGQIEAVRQALGNTEGDIGHWVLGVAHILPPSQDSNNGEIQNIAMGNGSDDSKKAQRTPKVRIRIFDSAPSTVSKAFITQTARNLVRTSGWLEKDAVPRFERSCVFEDVPNQAGKANTCGFHVILNAWSVMLDNAICTGGRRRNTEDSRFYSEGLEIMNLALAGFMDSATIQAFLIVHGYASGPYPSVQSSMVNPVAAARLDQNRFKELLRQQRNQEPGAPSCSSDDGAPADKWKQLRELVSSHISDERLSEALIMARGNVDEAADNLFKTTPSPTSPSTNITAPGATAQTEGGDEPCTFAGSNTEAVPSSLAE